MKTIFITFADRKLSPTLKIIKKEAIDSGFFDEVKIYDDRTFDKEYWKKYHSFYEKNPRVWLLDMETLYYQARIRANE